VAERVEQAPKVVAGGTELEHVIILLNFYQSASSIQQFGEEVGRGLGCFDLRWE
jgi:hypothetical protein